MIVADLLARGGASGRRCVLWLAIVAAIETIVPHMVEAQPAPPLPMPTDAMSAIDAAAQVEEEPQETDPPFRHVYIPVHELGGLFRSDRSNVLLSREEFRRLWNAAKSAEETGARRPADVVLSQADYVAQRQGEQLSLTARIAFTQWSSDWIVLRLPVGGLSVKRVTLDGASAGVARDPQQPDMLLVFCQSAGAHQLELDLTADVVPVGSDGLAEFALVGAPSGTLRVKLPEGKSLSVDGLVVKAHGPNAQGSDYEIPIGGRSRVSLRVGDGEATPAADALLFARTAYGLRAAPGEVTWTTLTTLTVYGRSLDQLTFHVPRNLDIAAVESSGLASWDMNDDPDGTTAISLTYRQPISGSHSVTIRGVFAPQGEQWSVPTLSLNGADSHIASVLIEHDTGIRLQPEYDDTVRPALADEMSPLGGVSGSGAPGKSAASSTDRRYRMAFHAMRPDFELSFFSPRKTGAMQAALTTLLHVSDAGLEIATILDVQAAVAPLFEVRLTLPAEFEVTGVAVAGQPSDWMVGSDDVGQIEVRIPLKSPLQPGVSLRIDLSAHADPEDWPVERNPVLLQMPRVGLPQADMVEARYGITVDDDLDVTTMDLAGLDPARGEDAAGLRRLVQSSGRSLQLSYVDQDTEFSGELEVARRPSTFSVSTLVLSRLEPERTVTQLTSTITVETGGLEGLLIQLPESVAADARFELSPVVAHEPQAAAPPAGTTIVEQTISAAQDGNRTWALRFDRRLHGTQTLSARLIDPRTEGASVPLSAPIFIGADRHHGWIAVEARDDQRLTVTAADVVGRPLRAIDPIDLPGMASDEPGERRIIAGFRFSRPGATANVTEEQFSRAVVPTAVADQLALRSLLAPSGELQHRLAVTFRAAGVQNLQFTLPPGCDLWAVEVDSRPIEVRHSPRGYQVPLPPTDSPEAVRTLHVYYSSHVDELSSHGRVQQSEPQLAVQLGNGESRPLDVLARDWTLMYPKDLVLLESQGHFSPAQSLHDGTIFNRFVELARLTTGKTVGALLGGVVATVFVV
ncbi:MAG: hypothetical protein KF861_15930, partial [Planctomycetaceae bacterium]|nr:hypothetical protein [Planctomycetaceae bacterium]